ncbi:hypothetical protein ABZX66_28280 [Micromonospora aurantiaca]|uniref:hypothetical protein n=1 Tax=Micromonospora aurantiaca (nom. illeg.) TaxID=47850 RepID=UPI0033B4EF2D
MTDQQSTENTEPTVKRADALQVGDHVMRQETPFDPRRPLRVLFTHPFRDGDGVRRVALMLDTPRGPIHERPLNCDPFELADEQDLAEAHDAARRQQLLDDLTALRHVLDAAGVRMSTYQANPLYVHLVEGEVDRLADLLTADVRPFGADGHFAVDWTAPGDTDIGDRLTVKLYGRRAPEPEPTQAEA